MKTIVIYYAHDSEDLYLEEFDTPEGAQQWLEKNEQNGCYSAYVITGDNLEATPYT